MEYELILKEVKKLIDERYGNDLIRLKYHIIPVVEYAKQFAKEFNSDLEVIELAAYLHDVTKITEGNEYHHITGAEYAREFLEERNFPKEKTDLVCKCIINHRGYVSGKRTTMEEKIIASADAIAYLEYPISILQNLNRIQYMPIDKEIERIKCKLDRLWNKIEINEIKNKFQKKYDFVNDMINSIEL